MPSKSAMHDAPLLNRRAKFLRIIRQIHSSRPLKHIYLKRRSKSSHGRKQGASNMSPASSNASRQDQNPSCSSTIAGPSAAGCSTVAISTKKPIKKDCNTLEDSININTEKDIVASDTTQSLLHKNAMSFVELSLTQDTTDHPSKSFMSSRTLEFMFPLKASNKIASTNSNSQTKYDIWAEMPYEISLYIFAYLTPKELVRVSVVSKRFHKICYDGQLWTSFDVSKFYKQISAESLSKILVSAGPFVGSLNLRGCIQVEHQKCAEAVKACHNLISTTLEGCRNFQRPTLHSLLSGNSNLVNLNLTGLTAVTNDSCKIIADNCPYLKLLDTSSCAQMDARGIRMIIQGCKMLKDLRTRETRGFDSIELAQDIFESNVLQRLVISGCTDLNDHALQTMIHGEDYEIDILTNIPLVPARKLRYLDISRCHRISDLGIKALAHLTCNLQCLILNGCSRIGDDGLKDVVKTTPHLTHLELEEVHHLTNDFLNETLAKSSCARILRHLSVSCCDQISDIGMQSTFRACSNLERVVMDNTNISDHVLSDAANMISFRLKFGNGQVQRPIIGLSLVVYDCQNVTWAGIREVMSRNAQPRKFACKEVPPDLITELIALKCFHSWQPTVNEHMKRLLRGDQQAALKLERVWADWMIANEEISLRGTGMRRRRRAREARMNHANEEQGTGLRGSRLRTRFSMNSSSCAIM